MLLQSAILLLGLLSIQGEAAPSSEAQTTNCTGRNSMQPYVELLRGRDGRDGMSVVGPPGRDGKDGEKGEPGIQGPPGPTCGGVVYTRWGRTTCPDTGAKLLYKGITAGSDNTYTGGGVNFLCLPETPEYSDFDPGMEWHNMLRGTEYQVGNPLPGLLDHNAPCALCYVSTREVAVMLPAKLTCPLNWTLEYNGYLMSERYSHKHSSTFECVDKDPESIPGSAANTNGAMFHFNEASEVGIPFPPYNSDKEITCAVCSI